MLNNFLFTVALLAQVTGLSLPHILAEEDFYWVPTVNEQNEVQAEVLPAKAIPLKEGAPERKPTANLGPENIDARAAIVMDKASGKILWQKNPDTPLSIASITKLMTALVFLDHNPGWQKLHQMTGEENWLIGANLPVGDGEEVSNFNLFRSAMVGSRNNAALALAHATNMSDENFKKLMNEKAKILHMDDSVFVEPTGLEAGNLSTVEDLAKLGQAAFSRAVIYAPLTMESHEMKREGSDEVITILNTDKLLQEPGTYVQAGKTGYTDEAGYCFLSLAEDEDGHQLIVVVLGEPSEWERFNEAEDIAAWAFDNFTWKNNKK